jgi:hypothetical protein
MPEMNTSVYFKELNLTAWESSLDIRASVDLIMSVDTIALDSIFERETLDLRNLLQHGIVDAVHELVVIHRATTRSQALRNEV